MPEFATAARRDAGLAPGFGDAPGSARRLALIDDDRGLLRVLGQRLEQAGWRQRVLASAVPVEDLVALRPDALVVDVALLGTQAAEYLQAVASRMPGLGIVVCTGRSSVAQRVRGLRAGADDWVQKPCHPDELLARIEAVVRRRRRAAPPVDPTPRVSGELTIRRDQFQAFARQVSAELTKREFELLELLATAEGRVLEREQIYQCVWGYAMVRGDRSVDVFVRKLRQKLERVSPGWRYIHTHFGVGYRFGPEPIAVVAEPRRPAGRIRSPDEVRATEAAAGASVAATPEAPRRPGATLKR